MQCTYHPEAGDTVLDSRPNYDDRRTIKKIEKVDWLEHEDTMGCLLSADGNIVGWVEARKLRWDALNNVWRWEQ